MKRAYLGVAIVGAAVVVSGTLGDRVSVVFIGVAGDMAYGLYAATAAIALWAYRQERDPAILLVGAGTAAVAGHHVLVVLVFALIGTSGSSWPSLVGFSVVVGHLVLLGSILAVAPWRDRRGRPPIAPAHVAAAVLAGLAVADMLVLVVRPSPPGMPTIFAEESTGLNAFSVLCGLALLGGGVVAAVRSLLLGGRHGWIAGAGVALALLGLTIVLGPFAGSEPIVRTLITWQLTAPTLIAGSLVAFVLGSLHIQTSLMRRASDRAAEVMEGRAEIASTIAHDVRGPVGTIKGLATTTRKSYARLGDAERLEFIGMIEQESSRLMRLVDQVAMALKVDAGSLELTPRTQALEPLIRQAIDATEDLDRPVDVEVPRGIEVPADTRWIVEAVRQGLDNAIGFSPPGSPIAIHVLDDATSAVVAISDRGPGIPSELRPSLFEKFSRWRPPGYEDRQGSGLGLFITRGIARTHGGEATLDDAPAGGTMLRIRLPKEEMGD